MNKYRIKVEAIHPKYEIDSRFTEGIECAGFLMVAFNENGKPKTEGLDGVSTSDIAYYIANGKDDGGPVSNILLQAGEIAKGIIKAAELKAEYEHERRKKAIQQHIEGMKNPDLFGEEDEEED